MKVDMLKNKLLNAKKLYYATGESNYTDLEFDNMEDELFRLDPDNEYFKKVGYSGGEMDNTIKHQLPMLSSDKVKSVDGVIQWIKKLDLEFDTAFIIEPKIDGLSASIFYEKGKLKYISTRGDGKIGQNISHIAEYINIPKELESSLTVEIRGELFLPKNTQLENNRRPLRNMCVGLINRKENREDLKYVNFCAYQIITEDVKIVGEDMAIGYIKSLGFSVVEYFMYSPFFHKDNLEMIFNDYLTTYREKWLYETDGLMIIVNDRCIHKEIDSRWIVSHHHHYCIALKPPAESKITTLESIEWNVSRTGYVIPIAIFNPVVLGSSNISRASLHNSEFILHLNLFIGDELEIERANDVIPYIKRNVSSHTGEKSNLLIERCPSCNSLLKKSGVHLKCHNDDCYGIKSEQILYWVKNCGMDNIGESTIYNLVKNNKIGNISDLYKLKYEDFDNIEGFAHKKISNFLEAIEKSKKQTTHEFINNLGINLVGKRALKKLNINNIDDFLNFNDSSYVIGKNLIEWRDDPVNELLVSDLLDALTIANEEETVNILGDVCMTGKYIKTRDEMEKILIEKGYAISNSINNKTKMLLCENINDNSTKLEKAKKLNITIKTYEDFFKE